MCQEIYDEVIIDKMLLTKNNGDQRKNLEEILRIYRNFFIEDFVANIFVYKNFLAKKLVFAPKFDKKEFVDLFLT